MITKMIYLVKRNPTLSEQEFPQSWKEHSALSSGFQQLKSMVSSVNQCSNVRDPAAYPGASLDYDGVGLLTMRDKESASSIWTDPDVIATCRQDELRVFSDYVINFTMVTEENVIIDAPRGKFCLFLFGKRNAGYSRDKFLQHWIEGHSRLLRVLPSVAQGKNRLVVNAITGTTPTGCDYDGISELWFDSLEDVSALAADVHYRSQVLTDLYTFCEEGSSVTMLTQVTHARPQLASFV